MKRNRVVGRRDRPPGTPAGPAEQRARARVRAQRQKERQMDQTFAAAADEYDRLTEIWNQLDEERSSMVFWFTNDKAGLRWGFPANADGQRKRRWQEEHERKIDGITRRMDDIETRKAELRAYLNKLRLEVFDDGAFPVELANRIIDYGLDFGP